MSPQRRSPERYGTFKNTINGTKRKDMSTSPVPHPMPLEGAKKLQQRLNVLLTKLSRSIHIVKDWPRDGDDASDHVKTTSTLISSILEIKTALENVEGTVKADAELRKALQNCPIPINLLDLLDHGNGLNPGTLFVRHFDIEYSLTVPFLRLNECSFYFSFLPSE